MEPGPLEDDGLFALPAEPGEPEPVEPEVGEWDPTDAPGEEALTGTVAPNRAGALDAGAAAAVSGVEADAAEGDARI